MRLVVLTTGRQDWGLLRPLCSALAADPSFDLRIVAGGMACSPTFGRVVDTIREQGLEVAAELDWKPERHSAVEQSAAALSMVAGALTKLQPDALVLLGDRFETAAAALAATILAVPIVHLFGGEETEGAVDNALRHAITKLSHLHLVAHPLYAERVIQMGEDPASVHVVGSLATALINRPLPDKPELERALGVELTEPIGLVTVHPTTLREDDQPSEVGAIIGAMEAYPATWIVTLPNTDPGHELIRAAFEELAAHVDKVVVTPALGEERYLGLMQLAAFVLGNSSSGLTEAPALRVPTVNVGDRQKGRIRSASVIDVPPDTHAIVEALQKAASPEFRRSIATQPLPFGSGDAARRMVSALRDWKIPRPPRKAFHSWRPAP